MSPLEFERKWIAVENKIVDRLSSFWPRMMSFIWLLLLLALVYYPLRSEYSSQWQDWARFNVISDRKLIVFFVSALSPICLFLPIRFLSFFGFSVGLSAVYLNGFFYKSSTLGALYVGGFLVLSILAVCISRKIKKNIYRFFISMVLIVSFFTTGILLAYHSVAIGNFHSLRTFWFTHPEHLLFYVVAIVFILKPHWSILLHPVNFINACLWPPETRFLSNSKDLPGLWYRGLLNLVFGQLLFALSIFFLKQEQALDITNQWVLSPLKYVYFCLVVVGGLNVVQGLSRMYGLVVPDMTYFYILSKTPLEAWRRGSTYIYRFFVEKVFVPIYRWKRSFIFAGMFCFFFAVFNLFWFHPIVIRGLNGWLNTKLLLGPIRLTYALASSLGWGIFWALVFSCCVVLDRHIKGLSSKGQWIAVLLNFCFMSYSFWWCFELVIPAVYKLLL